MAGTSPFPSFIPQIWHCTVLGHNPIWQPWEPLHSGRNMSFPSPYFQRGGHCHMTSRQVFIYRYKLVYVRDGTLGSHDMMGPMSVVSKLATFSEPNCTWLGTGNIRSINVHKCFLLSDSPLMFEFSLTRPHSNLRPG
jgi:hypothetical protein